MLSVKRTMLLFLLALTTATLDAQQNQAANAAVFNNFSQTIDLSETTLSNAMQMSKGQQATFNFGNDFDFPGVVLSNEMVFENLQTIIIRSSAYNNALLQISKQINEDKTISYVGRIFGKGSADGYEIKRTNNGGYQLEKFETANILQDCNLQ
ncbi:MAG TPA: hypothetical protein VLR49_03140 [Ferruginibacter sp.]|nr:hypothetical protein [Ferruginibacter sp.]